MHTLIYANYYSGYLDVLTHKKINYFVLVQDLVHKLGTLNILVKGIN